jgi:hypothetical protein
LADPGAFPLGALWRGIVSERQAMSDLLQPTGDLHHCHPKADSLLDEDALSPTSGLLQPHLHECKILKGRAASYLPAGGKLAMTDIYPATLMLAVSLAIWAGIAWVLIERIG